MGLKKRNDNNYVLIPAGILISSYSCHMPRGIA